MTPCQKLLKQEGTARRIESMQQSSATLSLHLWFLGVAEDCCMLSILLAVPSCFNSFWHGVIPTSYFIFNDFYTCILYYYHHIPQQPRATPTGSSTIADSYCNTPVDRSTLSLGSLITHYHDTPQHCHMYIHID